ncbi:hypothetical protein ABPG75_004589 [Micractinium tetrahymenae]
MGVPWQGPGVSTACRSTAGGCISLVPRRRSLGLQGRSGAGAGPRLNLERHALESSYPPRSVIGILGDMATCTRDCQSLAFAPLCYSNHGLGNATLPNLCAYSCLQASSLNPRLHVEEANLSLEPECRQEWEATGQLTGGCALCPSS